jgi:hypothetical protein
MITLTFDESFKLYESDPYSSRKPKTVDCEESTLNDCYIVNSETGECFKGYTAEGVLLLLSKEVYHQREWIKTNFTIRGNPVYIHEELLDDVKESLCVNIN